MFDVLPAIAVQERSWKLLLFSAIVESVGFKPCGFEDAWVTRISVYWQHLKKPVFVLQ